MPSSSTISSSDKSKVKHALPSSTHKILTATVARVYAAHPNPSSWSYAGVEGALAFVKDLSKNSFALKVVDLKDGGGVLFEHELYEPLSYNQDRTFFHTLQGDEFLIGFAFADEGEAGEFYKKINNRQKYIKGGKSTGGGGASSSGGGLMKRKSKGGAKIDKSMISSPSEFKHVSHMGFSSEKGFTSENVDPSWQSLLEQLSNMGVSRKDIEKNEGFIKDFVGKRGGPGKGAAPPAAKAKKVPPPAPSRAPTTARKQPPPPPAPRVRPSAAASPAAAVSTPPAPPPPPPVRGGGAGSAAAPPPPPPPPARGGGAPPPPPPPPPAPARGGPPPPPPPPPAGSGGGAPPPPPPPPPPGGAPPAAASLPPPQSGRADLLASIQGQSVAKLRKTDHSAAAAGAGAGAAVGAGAAAAAASSSAADDGGGADGGGDLASALAAALSARKDNMGDSDDDVESEEEW